MALTFALTITFLIAAYSAALFYMYRQDSYRDLNKKLRRDIESMEMLLAKANSSAELNKEDIKIELQKLSYQNFDPSNWLTEVWTLNGERIYATGSSENDPLGKPDASCFKSDSESFDKIADQDLKVRIFCIPSESLPNQYVIRVARLTETINLQLSRFLILMLLGAPLIVLLSGVAGYLLAKRALLPIASLTKKAKTISAEKLNERLPIHNPDDELGELAKTFNDTFERLENSFAQIKRFTGDASHELRTPLSAIRMMGEVALRQGKDSHSDTISGILEETARLQNLCESLLLLSRADSGAVIFNFQEVQISEIIGDTIDLLYVLAEEKNQTILADIPTDLKIKADVGFLRQAIINLVDNAIKYSPANSKIIIQAKKVDDAILLSIKDNGPGIALEHQSKIFDRFYRIDLGRTRNVGGTGLGLSICQWIINAHKGSVTLVSSLNQGTEFIIRFPLPKETS